MPIDLPTIALLVATVGGCLSIFGVPFMIYTMYIRNRSSDNKKIQKSETEDLLLQQRTDIYHKQNQEKFENMQKQFAEVMTLNQNHIHTLDTKIDALNNGMINMGKEIVRLETTLAIFLKLPAAPSKDD